MKPNKIASCCIVHDSKNRLVLGIECKKGRGFIVPGGKLEDCDKGFVINTATRELEEETGLSVISSDKLVYLYEEKDIDGYDTYFWITDITNTSGELKETNEGIPRFATRFDFLDEKNRYIDCYDKLFSPQTINRNMLRHK